MKQKSIVVKVQLQDGNLDVSELNAALAEGWTVDQTASSTPGSILVILKQEPSE